LVTIVSDRRSREASSNRKDRKVAQLCAQVAEVVSLALGDSEDERLQQLVVDSVVAGPDGTRLVVRVVPGRQADIEEMELVYAALERARPWLKQQVAAEIHRKRAPELAFQVLPPWEVGL